jgi:hypothetical protein
MLKSRGQDAVGASKLGKPGVAVLPTRHVVPTSRGIWTNRTRLTTVSAARTPGDSIIGATLGPPPDTRGHPQTRTLANARNPHSRAKLATSRQQRQAPAADS